MSILALSRRRTVRAKPNPLDKSTIVSIYPREITEIKHTLEPGRFVIPAGSIDKPGILVVGPSSWWKDVDPEQPLLEIPTSSIVIADSIVKDYMNGLLACDMGGRMPGLFFLPGELTQAQVLSQHKELLKAAETKQRNWFAELVRMADIMWSRSNGNPLAISDDARLAAEILQVKANKPWMSDFTTMELKNCPFCGTLRNNNYPVCSNCHHVVDKVAYDKLGSNQKVG